VSGQKLSPFTWATTAGWAEGFFVASLKRNAQALEIRLAIDQMLDQDPHRLIAIAGDLNAEDGEVPLKLLLAAEEDTGNGDLGSRSLIPIERSIARDQRFSVLHHGRPQMLDHILVSRTLFGHVKHVEAHNESLADEVVGATFVTHAAGSYHAPLVADFAL
jgi:predicted extracellular nuclease